MRIFLSMAIAAMWCMGPAICPAQTPVSERFYQAIQISWDEWDEQKHFTTPVLENVNHASSHLAATSREVVDELFPLCGLIAADTASAINRVWRNLHTACLHPLLFG